MLSPGRALTPAQEKQFTAQRTAEKEAGERALAQAQKSIEQWTNDEAAVPELAISAPKPSYQETLDFINGKIKGKGQKLWFGKATGKMILSSPFNVCVFNPADLNPDLKIGRQQGFGGIVHFVRAECRENKKSILGQSRSDPKQWSAAGITLDCRDEVDVERVAKALRHLILIFGGKAEAF